jgi:undecaprenyl diphosphate synthase
MLLLQRFLRREAAPAAERGVRLELIGRRDRLPPEVARAAEDAEAATAGGATLSLRLAVDYSGRDAILAAAGRLEAGVTPTRADFSRALGGPDVDLLIRTGGERRLSDFLLWESAYAELVFLPTMWPDFSAVDLEAAVREFRGRERRFGRLVSRAERS